MADEKQVTFDSGQYDKLVKEVVAKEEALFTQFLAPSGGVRLAPDLDSMVKIGSTEWPKVAAVTGQLKALGESAQKMNDGMSQDWQSFTDAAVEAKKVFEDTDDLAQYESSKFTSEFPDLKPQGGGAS